MSWSRRQKFLVHLYARAAGLADPEYRQVLFEVSACRSAADRSLTQWHFDHVMARLETVLDYRISEGFVQAPSPRVIQDIRHWRSRLAAAGHQNGRQFHLWRDLWAQLQPHLPEAQRSDEYLGAIASRACAQPVPSVHSMPAWQAGLLISALRDRLHYAVRRGASAGGPP